ncbi:hypothetical protein [Plantibacter sp. YIM 135249]|uniref:DUF7882 family protein n=1 Tax=Plantibacter sp. YIM 135249 TaxID=3423918 RepID=UPI003D3391B6
MVGVLRIGPAVRYTFSDESLAYLQTVMVSHLLNHNPFTLHVQHGHVESPTTIAITEKTPILFFFDSEQPPQLDSATVRWMSEEIDLTGSLHFTAH